MNNVIPLRPDPLHEEFRKWYFEPAQGELRKGCAEGWAFKIWLASRAAIQIEIHDFDSFSPHDCGDFAVWNSELIKTLAKIGVNVRE